MRNHICSSVVAMMRCSQCANTPMTINTIASRPCVTTHGVSTGVLRALQETVTRGSTHHRDNPIPEAHNDVGRKPVAEHGEQPLVGGHHTIHTHVAQVGAQSRLVFLKKLPRHPGVNLKWCCVSVDCNCATVTRVFVTYPAPEHRVVEVVASSVVHKRHKRPVQASPR